MNSESLPSSQPEIVPAAFPVTPGAPSGGSDTRLSGLQLPTVLVIVESASIGAAPDLASVIRHMDGKSVAVEFLKPEVGGIEQVTRLTCSNVHQSRLESIHFLTTENQNGIQIGSDCLDAQTLQRHSAEIARWGLGLAEDAELVFHNCKLSSSWQQEMIESLQALTGSHVRCQPVRADF